MGEKHRKAFGSAFHRLFLMNFHYAMIEIFTFVLDELVELGNNTTEQVDSPRRSNHSFC